MAHWCSHSWDPGASKMVLGSNSNWSVGELLLGPVPMSLTCGCLKGLVRLCSKRKKTSIGGRVVQSSKFQISVENNWDAPHNNSI
jgi:hypothetical protein